jgi:RNA-directed DNA polymerase
VHLPARRGIDWIAVQRRVKGLQARIVKAVQDGRYNKARALQWLLTHSFSGKALAVKRVSENKGKNTPGVDKVTWNTPRAKIGAISERCPHALASPARQSDYRSAAT